MTRLCSSVICGAVSINYTGYKFSLLTELRTFQTPLSESCSEICSQRPCQTRPLSLNWGIAHPFLLKRALGYNRESLPSPIQSCWYPNTFQQCNPLLEGNLWWSLIDKTDFACLLYLPNICLFFFFCLYLNDHLKETQAFELLSGQIRALSGIFPVQINSLNTWNVHSVHQTVLADRSLVDICYCPFGEPFRPYSQSQCFHWWHVTQAQPIRVLQCPGHWGWFRDGSELSRVKMFHSLKLTF